MHQNEEKGSRAPMPLSILTATYNRGYCLHNLYRSLLEQTKYSFEWLIVDDGSTDETENLVRTWMKEQTPFPVRYIKKENGGKHTALNVGIRQAFGRYVFIVDSDDTLTADAVEKIEAWCKDIEDDGKFAGVSGCKGCRDGSRVGQFPMKSAYIDATNIERHPKHLMGDKAEIYRTDLLKKYPFPEFPGERYLPENIVFDEIAHDGYSLRWYRDIIYLCEYQNDGLSKNILKNRKNSFHGYTLAKKKAWRYYPFPYNWKALVSYIDSALACGKSKNDIMQNMEIHGSTYFLAQILSFVKTRITKRY